jgi:hypothetical protein
LHNLLTNIGRGVSAQWFGSAFPAGGVGSPAATVTSRPSRLPARRGRHRRWHAAAWHRWLTHLCLGDRPHDRSTLKLRQRAFFTLD